MRFDDISPPMIAKEMRKSKALSSIDLSINDQFLYIPSIYFISRLFVTQSESVEWHLVWCAFFFNISNRNHVNLCRSKFIVSDEKCQRLQLKRYRQQYKPWGNKADLEATNIHICLIFRLYIHSEINYHDICDR